MCPEDPMVRNRRILLHSHPILTDGTERGKEEGKALPDDRMERVQVDRGIWILVRIALGGHLHELIGLLAAEQVFLPKTVADEIPRVAPAVAKDTLHKLPCSRVVLPHTQVGVRKEDGRVTRLPHAIEAALSAQDDTNDRSKKHMTHEDVDCHHRGQHEVEDEHASVAGHALRLPGKRMTSTRAERLEAQALHDGKDHVDLAQEAEQQYHSPVC
mmetsp:Transcript_94068/g.223888  ORF Transcript_94068/g.223888 Transcript_94068/m.223888 type:complete len:214 (-) Transcript_94068:938-1579(-)